MLNKQYTSMLQEKDVIFEIGKSNKFVPYGDNPIVLPAPNGP